MNLIHIVGKQKKQPKRKLTFSMVNVLKNKDTDEFQTEDERIKEKQENELRMIEEEEMTKQEENLIVGAATRESDNCNSCKNKNVITAGTIRDLIKTSNSYEYCKSSKTSLKRNTYESARDGLMELVITLMKGDMETISFGKGRNQQVYNTKCCHDIKELMEKIWIKCPTPNKISFTEINELVQNINYD